MPIFDYRCPAGHVTEVVDIANQRREVMACPTCALPAERILFSAVTSRMRERQYESNVAAAIKRVKRLER